MDAADLTSCSDVFLRTIEDYGLAGGWHWTFTSGEQRWSPGFFRLLGLDPSVVTARYDLFVELLHPDDRVQLASPSEVVQGHVSPRATVRLIRPGGELRVLSVLSELRVSAEGRPLSLSGVVLDVTDRERLRQAQAAEQRRRQALYLTSYTATYSLGLDLVHHFPAEVAQVHGLSLEEIQVDPFLMLVPEERAAFRNRGWEMHDRHMRFQGMPRERLASGEVVKFRLVGVPVWSAAGEYRGWTGMKYPVHESGAPAGRADTPEDPALRRALEQAVRGHHLRAARGLLDWSMATLAAAGGLSLSTVRRLEDNLEGQGARSRYKAVTALRQAGIRFIAMDDGAIAVARV
ncbi:PAS domain-containing protein [Methylobacterium sp. SyP6R]|uniref:PAS domain-containing protein n=1 Tax=Methylobacterium sp. SyP6R TaxID=2718876 RepID=UPI001F023C6B|nr:PAS domain-containing protein [Methylobacterium sp. SyP6R]MCF4127014.1 PAS domain-containing protein [Methylobacterium sp. SyP6R]